MDEVNIVSSLSIGMIGFIHNHIFITSVFLCSVVVSYPQHPGGDCLLLGKWVLDRLVRDTELAVVGFNLVNKAKPDQDYQDQTPVLEISPA